MKKYYENFCAAVAAGRKQCEFMKNQKYKLPNKNERKCRKASKIVENRRAILKAAYVKTADAQK